MSKLVLGLNTDHGDSSAALVGEKGVVAAIAEERISRRKHCADFPALAIKEVLKIAGAELADVTDIAVARDPWANAFQKAVYLARYPESGIPLAVKRFGVHKKEARDQNELYYDLIGRFKELTGVPVLLNTSFNENEPIVNTPAQAIDCFERTKMDSLGIGSFWVEK